MVPERKHLQSCERFMVVAMLLQPAVGHMQDCQCNFTDRSWQAKMDGMIHHISNLRAFLCLISITIRRQNLSEIMHVRRTH